MKIKFSLLGQKTQILLFSSIGVFLSLFFLIGSDLQIIFWNILPYLISFFLALATQKHLGVLFGVLLMLIVDGWMYFWIVFRVESEFLLAISLLSTLKLVTVFPLGLILGYFTNWLTERSNN